MTSTAALAHHFCLDPAVTFLNHGSFGACPAVVMEAQRRLAGDLEREPVRFFMRELPERLDEARRVLAAFVGAPAADLVFVRNATEGVNAVLRSLALDPGDEIVLTDHEYGACRNAADFVATATGARVVVAALPFPVSGPDDVVEAVVRCLTSRTRLLLVDHITSPTGVVLPIARLVREAAARGVDTLVDGAHGPGQVALDIAALAPAYYVANCHKWLCAPRGAGLLYVRPDLQPRVRPLAISHGATAPLELGSRLRAEFDWTGTDDPTAWLCVPDAIAAVDAMLPGGWAEVRHRNHALAIAARDVLSEALGVPPPCPDGMLGAMAALPLPDGTGPRSVLAGSIEPLQDLLLDRYAVEVPIITFPAAPRRLVRVSAHVYNSSSQYERLAGALGELLAEGA